MADYATLKAAIRAVIYENGNQEITGSVMQATLLAMVNSLGAGYQFTGVATPSTDPGTPDARVFYLASAGTFPYFNNIVVRDGEIGIIKSGTPWDLTTIKTVQYIDDNNIDFAISDGNGYRIVIFKNGHIVTKKFDSADLENVAFGQGDGFDFAISDGNGNILLRLKDGHIQVKNFDSRNAVGMADVIGRYRGKRISILGDSISTFGVPSATNQQGTYCYSYYPDASCRYSQDGVDSIAFDVNNTWWMRLINSAGFKLGVNDSYRGSQVAGTTHALNLQDRINHLGGNGSPDVIVVFGGTNDAGNGVTVGTFNTENPQDYTDAQIAALPVTTFADAYRAMLIRLMKTYPRAEIVVILPTFTSSYYSITDLDLYVEVIKEACDFFGIKYIDARCTGITVYNRATYLVDGIHPNAEGMRLLHEKIYRQIIFN